MYFPFPQASNYLVAEASYNCRFKKSILGILKTRSNIKLNSGLAVERNNT